MDTNGLCLNGLHDKAFDRGFMTVDERYVIHISDDIADVIDGSAVDRYFKYYNGEKIILPDRFCQAENICNIIMMLSLLISVWQNTQKGNTTESFVLYA